MTNIKIKVYIINHSRVPNDYFLSPCRMNFSLNLREMVKKTSLLMESKVKALIECTNSICRQSPRKTEHKEKRVLVNTEWEN